MFHTRGQGQDTGQSPGVNVWKRMNMKEGVAGKSMHPERCFPGGIKVGKTTMGLLMNWMFGVGDLWHLNNFSGAAKLGCTSLPSSYILACAM